MENFTKLWVAGILGLAAFSCEEEHTKTAGPGAPAPAYPLFIDEQAVSINGYDSHAMEPFISKDGSFLFFNSLNDAVDTSLYYARETNDTAFTLQGKIAGVNDPPPHLDAVASMDIDNVFYFISTRNYPAVIENVQSGLFNAGTVTGVAPAAGDFYISSPSGWIVMDAEISKDGNLIYFVNAKFGGQPLPDESRIGIAVRNGVSFTKDTSSEEILQNVNNAAYLVYAPCISPDGKELYFTRIGKGTAVSEICVSVRSGASGAFSAPRVLPISGDTPEAVSLTDDGGRIYYHKRNAAGIYRIYTMRRSGSL